MHCHRLQRNNKSNSEVETKQIICANICFETQPINSAQDITRKILPEHVLKKSKCFFLSKVVQK